MHGGNKVVEEFHVDQVSELGQTLEHRSQQRRLRHSTNDAKVGGEHVLHCLRVLQMQQNIYTISTSIRILSKPNKILS